jgi:ornithine decarboxylase/alpha-1,3/alpha-1,6-mannosyltransferase
MTCDGRDVIANNIDMPSDIQVGDWIIMSGMGAYSYGSK